MKENPMCTDNLYSKRDLLKLMISSLILPIQSVANSDLNLKPLRLAVIGFGEMGEILVRHLLKTGAKIELIAVCDIWEYKLQNCVKWLTREKKLIPRTYIDYLEMLREERNTLDAVLVATPDRFHEEHVVASLQAGLHVYCETPISCTVASARRIVLEAQSSRKVFQCASEIRTSPIYRHTKELLCDQEKLLEPIVSLSSESHSYPLRRKKSERIQPVPEELLKKYGYLSEEEHLNWRFHKQHGIGYEFSRLSVQADFFRYILSSNPKSVVASGNLACNNRLGNSLYSIFEFEMKGQTVYCQSEIIPVTIDNHLFRDRIIGENGYAQILSSKGFIVYFDGGERQSVQNEPEQKEVAARWKSAYAKGLLGKEEPQIIESDGFVPTPFGKGHSGKYLFSDGLNINSTQPHNLDDFVKSIRDGVAVRGTALDGLAAMVMIEGVREAIKTGRKISFSDADFGL